MLSSPQQPTTKTYTKWSSVGWMALLRGAQFPISLPALCLVVPHHLLWPHLVGRPQPRRERFHGPSKWPLGTKWLDWRFQCTGGRVRYKAFARYPSRFGPIPFVPTDDQNDLLESIPPYNVPFPRDIIEWYCCCCCCYYWDGCLMTSYLDKCVDTHVARPVVWWTIRHCHEDLVRRPSWRALELLLPHPLLPVHKEHCTPVPRWITKINNVCPICRSWVGLCSPPPFVGHDAPARDSWRKIDFVPQRYTIIHSDREEFPIEVPHAQWHGWQIELWGTCWNVGMAVPELRGLFAVPRARPMDHDY
mmetsp:Transcript_25160/g.52312  ORF Transcript_25160/g.52312 Transcript_25160/m.52312 type:complete len:304 (-) Transcript_25160:673-1584(-)